jgi:pimeloyl-ACP methyl ester carboxylesterase
MSNPFKSVAHTVDAVQSPSFALLGIEPLRAAREFLRHKMATTRAVVPGDGHPVVIFPGLGADGRSVAPLRQFCRSLGYQAFDWGRGFNVGPEGNLDDWLEALASHVTELLSGHDQPASLIGWSLGGLYARELGKLMAPRLRQVITIGTPFNADADHTHAGWLYRLLGNGSAVFDPALSRRLRTPPPVRTTSIYSRSDGVVAWQTCRHDMHSSLVHDIEIQGSHLGMGWNRRVLDAVADRLGQASGPGRPFISRRDRP